MVVFLLPSALVQMAMLNQNTLVNQVLDKTTELIILCIIQFIFSNLVYIFMVKYFLFLFFIISIKLLFFLSISNKQTKNSFPN